MKADPKYFYMQFVVADWLTDPLVGDCEPATRGILIDWICNMQLLNRCGQLVGTTDQLSRKGRCSSAQVEAALADLLKTKAADVVTDCNKIVTVTNRRMYREYIARNNTAKRVKDFRAKSAGNTDETPYSYSYSNSHKTNTQSEDDCTRVFEELEQRLKAAYNRAAGDQLTAGEEKLLQTICQRPNAAGELTKLLAWRDKMPAADRRYFPQTLPSLLGKWTATLDRAQPSTKAAPAKFTPPPALKGTKLPEQVFDKLAAETLAEMKRQAR